MTRFRRGEGIWFDAGIVYVATTSDSKVHAYDTVTETIEVLYDGEASNGPLQGRRQPDRLAVGRHLRLRGRRQPRDLRDQPRARGRPVRAAHRHRSTPRASSAGAIFDPSGTRLFFSSQRAFGPGAIYEVTGPVPAGAPARPLPAADAGRRRPERISRSARCSRAACPCEVRVDRAVRARAGGARTPRLRRARRGAAQRARGRRASSRSRAAGGRGAPRAATSCALRPGTRGPARGCAHCGRARSELVVVARRRRRATGGADRRARSRSGAAPAPRRRARR